MRRPVRTILWLALAISLPFVGQPDPTFGAAQVFAPQSEAEPPAWAAPSADEIPGSSMDSAPVAASPVADRVAPGSGESAGEDAALEVVIDLRTLTLTLKRGEDPVKSYPVAAGKPSSPSPTGRFVISSIVRDPTWYPRGGSPVPPGPSNPLGSRWIGLSNGAYGIHGTNDDTSIGRYVSKGCIRMHNADVEELCRLVRVGIPVVLTDNAPTVDTAGAQAPASAKDAGDSRRSGGRAVE